MHEVEAGKGREKDQWLTVVVQTTDRKATEI